VNLRAVLVCAALLAGAATVFPATIATAAPTRYEAEAAPATCDGVVASNHTGYSGSGFCDGRNATGAAAQFAVDASASGTAQLSVRFANGTAATRAADIIVNGSRVAATSFETTGGWATWATKVLTVSVNSGSNTIRFSPTTANGLPNIDYLESTVGPTPTPCAPPSTSPSSPPSQPRVTVWLAGDSTMAAPSGGAACPAGWGHQFPQYFNSNVTVRNSAIGGRSIQTWLYDPNVTSTKNSAGECVINPTTYSTRWQAMLDSTNGMKPGDYLFIQFGINDGTSACPRHVGSARYQELLGVMARAAKARGAHPVFLTPVAAINCSGSTAVGNRGFITETNSAASANQVPVIDLHRLSYTLYNNLRFCPFNGDYGSGPVGAFFCNDHTHFEAAGARQIAGVVAEALRDQPIPLAAYLK
jgi:lysophospholipase L1-like esterase